MANNKYNRLCAEGSKLNQVICAILINLPSLAYGTALGWMSPMTLLLQSEQSPNGTPFTDQQVSWMASVTYLISVPANFIFAYAADKWGRKKTLMFCSVQFLLCWLIKYFWTHPLALIMARALIGVGVGGANVIIPLYVKEISEDSIRGALGTVMILTQTSGTLLLYILGDVLGYKTIIMTCLSIPAIHIILFLLMPESPSFLVKQGDNKEAARALSWLRCLQQSDPAVQMEVDILRKELDQNQNNEKFSIKSILTNKVLLRAFRIAMVLSVVKEACGVVAVLNFAGDIFKKTAEGGRGLPLSPNQQTMMLGAMQVFGSAVASSLVEKAGRKLLLGLASFASGFGMLSLASWFVLSNLGYNTPDWLPIAALWVCIFCNGCGFQPVTIVIISELFSFQHRSTASALGSALGSFADFIQMLIFKPLSSLIGIYSLFYFFAAVCLLNSLYILIAVPETKLKTIEQVYNELKTKKELQEEDRNFQKMKNVIAV